MAEQIVTEFKQLIRQAGLITRSMSDNIHLMGLFRKALNYSLTHKMRTLHSPTTFLRNSQDSWNSEDEEILVNFPNVIPGPFLVHS